MKNKKSSGSTWLLIIGAVVLLLLTQNIFPVLGMVLAGLGSVLMLLVIGFVVLLVVTTTKKDPQVSVQQERTQILNKGRANVMELRKIAMRIQNPQVRAANEEICKTVEKILGVLKNQPEDIPVVRQFLNYYLPTLGNILQKFAKVEASGVDSGDMVPNTLSCLRDIQTAAEKQYANLFEDDLLDLSVEMETLTLAAQRDGLLEEEPSQREGITLTL